MSTQLLVDGVAALRTDGAQGVVAAIQRHAASGPAHLPALLRGALLAGRPNAFDVLRLDRTWQRAGRPALKPAPLPVAAAIVADWTSEGLPRPLQLFAAAMGMDLSVSTTPFDSVEMQVLDPASALYAGRPGVVIVLLSEEWWQRSLGTAALVDDAAITAAVDAVRRILEALRQHGDARILVAPPWGESVGHPGRLLHLPGHRGRTLARLEILQRMQQLCDQRTALLDLDPIGQLGRDRGLGLVSRLRARIPFEPDGLVCLARQLALALAALHGRSHRAIVCDLDNTLWGGVAAEDGFAQVVCGREGGDALGYRLVQEHLQGLLPLGLVLAVASRNQPGLFVEFDSHPGFALRSTDFASAQLHLQAKSLSISRIEQDLGFASDLMAFLDDSPQELVEVLLTHPWIDIVPAGPTPEQTLLRLAEAGIGCIATATEDDLQRHQRLGSRVRQLHAEQSAADPEEFLRSLAIRLTFSALDQANAARLEQLFHKTNQFNLTTRRHTAAALQAMVERGGTVVGVHYQDAFGSQGLIGAYALVPGADGEVVIDSLLMSCRVLNRRVEDAMFRRIRSQTAGRSLVAEYLPTAKNGLVRELLPRWGFVQAASDGRWTLPAEAMGTIPAIHATIRDDAVEG